MDEIALQVFSHEEFGEVRTTSSTFAAYWICV